MALTKVTFSMIDGASINVRDYGAVGNGTTDDTAAIQSAITAASTSHQMVYLPVGKYKITATLTVPASGYLYMVGDTGAAERNSLDYTKFSTLFFAPTGADKTLLDFGNNCYFNFERTFFVSNDVTQAYTAVLIGVLANYTSQTSATSPFLISQCSFHSWGATALSLGGETYGAVEHCVFSNCTQAIAVNGQGEVTFYENHFSDSANASFTPPANNGDAWIYVYETVTRWDNNIFANSNDYRIWFLFDECTNVSFSGNKMEHPGRTALTYDQIQIKNATILGQTFSFTQNAMTASSATGSFAGRFLSTKGSVQISNLVFCDNTATYGAAVASGIPIIDLTTNKPKSMDISGVYREGSDNAIVKFTTGANEGNEQLFAGLKSTAIRFATFTTRPFTILASQTGATPNFDTNGYISRLISLAQVLPVVMQITTDQSSGDNVSFYLSVDTTKTDKATVTTASYFAQKIYPIRGIYIQTPSLVTAQTLQLLYDSGASASTSTKYTISFTYAIVDERSTSSGDQYFIST